MKHITSVQNDIVKKIVTLNTSKGRTLHKEYLAEGLRTLERFAAAQKMPKELYVVESLYTDAKILFPSADVTVVTDHVMKRISSLMTPPGILGVFDLPSESLQNEVGTGNQSGLVLVDISDPGNMGALIRSMVACGYKKIYVIGGVDPFSPKVIQASAGTIACVDVIECAWQELVDANGRSPLAAMVVTGGDALTKLDAQNLLFHCV